MANMVPVENVVVNTAISLAAGEQISIRILNADGSVKTIVVQDSVPAGKTATGNTTYYLTLA